MFTLNLPCHQNPTKCLGTHEERDGHCEKALRAVRTDVRLLEDGIVRIFHVLAASLDDQNIYTSIF